MRWRDGRRPSYATERCTLTAQIFWRHLDSSPNCGVNVKNFFNYQLVDWNADGRIDLLTHAWTRNSRDIGSEIVTEGQSSETPHPEWPAPGGENSAIRARLAKRWGLRISTTRSSNSMSCSLSASQARKAQLDAFLVPE